MTALLRRLLRTVGIDLGTGELSRAPGGKPAIAHRSGLRFNASHSDGRCLIAFSRGREVAVDVARLAPTVDLDALVEQGRSSDGRLRYAVIRGGDT